MKRSLQPAAWGNVLRRDRELYTKIQITFLESLIYDYMGTIIDLLNYDYTNHRLGT